MTIAWPFSPSMTLKLPNRTSLLTLENMKMAYGQYQYYHNLCIKPMVFSYLTRPEEKGQAIIIHLLVALPNQHSFKQCAADTFKLFKD